MEQTTEYFGVIYVLGEVENHSLMLLANSDTTTFWPAHTTRLIIQLTVQPIEISASSLSSGLM